MSAREITIFFPRLEEPWGKRGLRPVYDFYILQQHVLPSFHSHLSLIEIAQFSGQGPPIPGLHNAYVAQWGWDLQQ